MESLRDKTIKNLAIVYFFKFLWMGINFGRSIILARLLFPSDFGIVALATTFIYFTEQLFTFGFSKVIIHKKNISQDELNVAFTLNLMQNVIFFLLVFFAAPYVAEFYDKPVLTLVVRLLGFQLLFQIIGYIPRVYLQKKFRFKALEGIDIASRVLSTVVIVALAFTGWSFWSIVYGTIIGALVRSIAYMWFSKLGSKISFDRQIIKEYFHFGIVIYITALLTYLNMAIDTMVIGKIGGLVLLGFYTVAKQWGKYFHDNLFAHITKVMFPTYAHIQNDLGRLNYAYKKTVRMIYPFFASIYVGFILVAPDFVTLILGEKWIPAIVPLQIMLGGMLVESLGWTMGPITDAIGKFEIRLKITVIRFLGMITVFPLLGTLYSVPGFTAGLALMNVITSGLGFYLICYRELDIVPKHFLSILLPASVAAFLMACVILIINYIFLLDGWWRLGIDIGAGAVTFTTIYALFAREEMKDAKLIIQSFLQRKTEVGGQNIQND